MNRRTLHLAALALPLLGLGALWFNQDRLSRLGTEWDVPVRGYDPRDLLQGHYVQFQYDWPASDLPDPERAYGYNALCLEGAAPRLERTRILRDNQACPAFVREDEAQEGRLYASQAEALRLQEKLQDPGLQGVIRFRLRPDGHITPLQLTFRPRPAMPAAPATPAP